MSKVLDQSVTSGDGDTYDFMCPGVVGSPCGDRGGDPFRSTGWPTKKTATARGAEHLAEHKGEGVTSSLEDFRAKHGLGVNAHGTAVRLEDI